MMGNRGRGVRSASRGRSACGRMVSALSWWLNSANALETQTFTISVLQMSRWSWREGAVLRDVQGN